MSSSFNRERFQVFYRRLQSPQSRASQLLKRHRSPGVRSHWTSVFRQTIVGKEPNLQVQIRAGFPIQPQSHIYPSPLYVSRTNHLHLAGFVSAKLRKHQVTWLPFEVEALSIAASVKYFSPFIIQSPHPTTVLTDRKPCVQAIDKLCRGEFSASPRVTSFLTTVSRYQVNLQHLAWKANLPSDFTSRNARDCSKPNCQI